MTTETILTDLQLIEICQKYGPLENMDLSRAIEQAVLQSPEIQALRKDAGRYRWLRDGNGYYPEENYLRGGVELDDGVDLAMEQQK